MDELNCFAQILTHHPYYLEQIIELDKEKKYESKIKIKFNLHYSKDSTWEIIFHTRDFSFNTMRQENEKN